NDLFLYVVRVLTTKIDEFQYISARFETHRQAITYYFESIPDGKKIIESVISLNSIWKEHILIVEDKEDIANLLTAVFKRYGNIDHAKNGAEALEMLKKRYYKLIISDMEMPVMNGKVFFLAARDMYPNFCRKFLFHTGNQQANHLQFFKENNIQYIYKPAPLSNLRRKALRILHNSNYSEKDRYKIEQTLKINP
ncbi:MAG: response regulator, partial [Bacteroidetes bacterium]|nr:response regulator [Bacteroidota bacterium]